MQRFYIKHSGNTFRYERFDKATHRPLEIPDKIPKCKFQCYAKCSWNFLELLGLPICWDPSNLALQKADVERIYLHYCHIHFPQAL